MRYLSVSNVGKSSVLLLAVVTMLGSSGCGPKQFSHGEYDDPARVELLDDRFNENDMQQLADSIIRAMTACPSVAKAAKPPVVSVEEVQNRTEEHIDMVPLSAKIRTALIKTGKVRFVNNAERGTIDKETAYQDSGRVSKKTKKAKDNQTGVDYQMSGSLSTNIQQVGNDKLIYYVLTMNFTNLETSEIDCTEEKEIRKKYRKRTN